MNLKMRTYDEDLTTRLLGGRIKEEIEQYLTNTEEKIYLDFTGVLSISHSCADEAFAILAKEKGFDMFKKRIVFSNLDEDGKMIVAAAIANRLSEK